MPPKVETYYGSSARRNCHWTSKEPRLLWTVFGTRETPSLGPHQEDCWLRSVAEDEYRTIRQLISESRSITTLTHDWDGEGGSGYSIETWKRATEFLLHQARFARQRGWAIGIPSISPADAGSIDLYWKSYGRDLLINIPAKADGLATYYGETRRGDTISGVVKTDAPRPDLVAWLNHRR
jgi:hypothetical protein